MFNICICRNVGNKLFFVGTCKGKLTPKGVATQLPYLLVLTSIYFIYFLGARVSDVPLLNVCIGLCRVNSDIR